MFESTGFEKRKACTWPDWGFCDFSVSYMLMPGYYFEIGRAQLLQNPYFLIVHGHTPCYSMPHNPRETETAPLNTVIKNYWHFFFLVRLSCRRSYRSSPIRPLNKSHCLPLFWRTTNTSVKIANPWFKSRHLTAVELTGLLPRVLFLGHTVTKSRKEKA
jgi:hypothetical protein